MKNPQTCRPIQALKQLSQEYPGIWKRVEKLHQIAHEDDTTPDWCYLPLSAAGAAIVSSNPFVRKDSLKSLFASLDMARVAALSTWRMTKGIYKIDPEVLSELEKSSIDDAIPSKAFMTLPEWCCYCETPGLEWIGQPMHGMFIHLEWDAKMQRQELRFLLDTDEGLLPEVVHLGPWSLAEGVARATNQSILNGLMMPEEFRILFDAVKTTSLDGLVSIALYLCTQAGEIENSNTSDVRPCNPLPRKVGHGQRLFARDCVQTWNVAFRIGAKLRASRAANGQFNGSTGAGKRAHFRRAHWHLVLSGPMLNEFGGRIPSDQRKSELRWRYPIHVNKNQTDDELPATIRAVE